MTLDDIEDLIRRFLSAGVAVVLVLVAPGAVDDRAGGHDPAVVRVEPERSAEPDTRAPDEDTAPPEIREYEPPGTEPDEKPRPDADAATAETEPDGEPRDTTRDEGETDGATDSPADGDSGDDGDDADGADEPADEPANEPSADEPGHEPRTDTGGEEAPTGDGDDGDRPAPEDTDGPDPDLDARGPADGSVPDPDDRDATGVSSGDTEGTGAADTTGGGSEGVTAAERLGWGTPDREDDFTAGSAQWNVYDGPGHAGEGRRSPDAVSISDGVLVLTGDSAGTTAGMSWGEGQMYGRWEGRVRAPASDPSYNALLLLWPDAEDFPVGGEIDFMEMLDPTRQETDFFLHFGEDNEQVNGRVEVDGTRWHNWAVEWAPDAITAYVDGEEWFRTTDPSTFPPGPMHLCIQLDWFPEGSTQTVQESRMEVDWVRRYPLDREPIVGDTVGTGEAEAEEQTVEQADAPVTDDEPDPLRRMFSWG